MTDLAMPEPQIQERAAQPYLAIPREVTQGVAAAVDTAFPELFAWLRDNDVAPAGAPFIRYRELDPTGEPLRLDVGVPVAAELAGDERVRPDILPAGRYATLLHVGPYRSESARDLGDARTTLMNWTADRGLVYAHETEHGLTLPCCLEHYRIGPVDEPDASRWETEFAYLIVDEPAGR